MGGRRRWQELLQQLSEELERQSSRLEQLERGRDVEPDINASGSLGITAGSSGFSQDPSRSKSFSLSVRSNWTAKALRQGRSRSSVLTPSAGWAIAPQGFFYSTVWYFVMTTSSIYVGLITPIQAFAVDLDSTFLLVGLCVDAAFVADMVLQFFVQISIPTSLGVKRISKLSIIAKNYLTGWFVFDFAVAMPFDLLGLALHWPEGAIRLLWLSKLLRLVKWSRLSKVLTVPFSIQHQQEWLLLRFLGLLILLCHWFACLWNLALPLAPRGAPTWLTDSNANQESSGLPPITKWQSYLMGFYFSSYTMTSVGYGDIGPKNDLEMGICTLMVVCTGFTWAYVLGQICTIVSGMNEDSQAFRMRMHNLNAMMQTEDLPASLQERLRQFFLHNRNLAQHLNYQNLLSSMSPQLQSEVCFASNLEWLRKVSFFDEFIKLFESLEHQGMPAGSYRSCIAEISRRLKCHAFAQEETFESSQVLCILSKGLCLVNGVLQHKGDVWGEDFVLADRQLARTLRCQALTYIEILHLSRASLMEVIEEKRFACPRLGDVVHSFRRRLAARRAILLEAKSRRKKFPL